jgi:hypothetical protein
LLPPKTNQVEDSSGIEIYFLHSRHPQEKGMDTYTWPEEMCIMKFENATKTKPCLYYLMSDREVTLNLLNKAIQNKTQCKVRMVGDRSQGKNFSNEHGPCCKRLLGRCFSCYSSTTRDDFISHESTELGSDKHSHN